MGLAYNIICYFAGCMCSKFVSSVLATTVGIPDMGNAEGRISVSHMDRGAVGDSSFIYSQLCSIKGKK